VLYLCEVQGRSPLSGAENHLWVLLPALISKGIDVELVALLWLGDDFAETKRKLGELRAQGVKITVIKRGSQRGAVSDTISKIVSWLTLWRFFHERRSHIIHLHLEMVYAPFIAWTAGCRKIVLTIHNDKPIFSTRPWRIWLHLLSQIVSHYVAISERVRSYFVKVSGARTDQVTMIYYGIEPPILAASSRQEFGIPEDAFVVGFVGRLIEQKNPLVFLQALHQRPRVLGVIVGNGSQREELTRFVEKQQIGNVRFLGAVPGAARLMPLFDLFCLPSLWEGLGLVLIEATLQRVPVIGSNRGAIPEVLGMGRYGVLFEPTVEGLVQAIDFALHNPAVLRERAELAYAYVREQFTVEHMVQKTIRVYESVDDICT